jgi:hypothetical protein
MFLCVYVYVYVYMYVCEDPEGMREAEGEMGKEFVHYIHTYLHT